MMEYDLDNFLNLAGIQHFAFCRRQWALIHIEQQWQENLRTIEGRILHEAAHNDEYTTRRKGVIITRGMPVFSRALGVNGICDIVELQPSPNGVTINGADGKYIPVPVEYKRGKIKEDDCDRLQLCAQAMCLEEMLLCDVPKGYLYYGSIRRREEVQISYELKEQVRRIAAEMHELYDKCYTPKVKTGPKCKACSLSEICIPKLCKNLSAKKYMTDLLLEE